MEPREFLTFLLSLTQGDPALSRALPIGLIRYWQERFRQILLPITPYAPGKSLRQRRERRRALALFIAAACAVETAVTEADSNTSIASQLIDCIRGVVEGNGRLVPRPADERCHRFLPRAVAAVRSNQPRRASHAMNRLYSLTWFPF